MRTERTQPEAGKWVERRNGIQNLRLALEDARDEPRQLTNMLNNCFAAFES